MAITATLVGSLGGASIGSQAVSFSITELGTGLRNVGTINVPSGGDYRLVLVGPDTGVTIGGASRPDLLFNGTDVLTGFSGCIGASVVIPGGGTVSVQVRVNTSVASGRPTFNGTAYWWPAT